MPQARIDNGVNVDQIFGTIDAIKDNPAIAKFHFRAHNVWVNGANNRTTIDDFDGACQTFRHTPPFVLQADEPQVLLGTDRGANPVEYVLTGLASCLMTSMVYHAAARGIALHDIEARLEGDLDLHGFLGMDDRVRNGYEAIRVTFDIKDDLPTAVKEELIQLAQARSPVFDIVTHTVPVAVGLAG
jgi:uncharacterized OsmC-like protein